MKHVAWTATLAVAFVAASLLSGSEHRKGATVGAAISGLTAVASILLVGRVSRGGGKVVQRALAVMTGAFLLRLVLVGVATILVARAGESIVAFVVGFFVPFFVFAALEGAYVHSLSSTGKAA